MKDFMTFRRMLTPVLIQIIFWLSIIACLVTGIYDLIKGPFSTGLQVLILGPIISRITCEFIILVFRINETLTDIRNKQIQLLEQNKR